MDMGCIHTFDIGKVIVDVVAHKRSTHQAICFELGNVRCLSGGCSGVGYRFIAVQEGAVIVISDIGQNLGAVTVNVAGDILRHIQKPIILQPLDVVSGVFQRPKNAVVIHLIRDSVHVC